MENLFSLVLLYIAVFFYLSYLVSMKALTMKKEEKILFRNSFPVELHRVIKKPVRIFEIGILFVASFLSIWSLSMYLFSLQSLYLGIVCGGMILSFIGVFFSHIIPLDYYKFHIITALVGFVFYSFSTILLGLSAIVPGAITLDGCFNIGISIVIGVLGFLVFLSLFNPKLMNWAKMDKTEVDGTTIYVKPKRNYLAIYEWMMIVLHIVSLLLLSINIIVTNP